MSRHKHHQPTLVEAVETLSSIASMDAEHHVAEADLLAEPEEGATYRTVHWLQGQDEEATVKAVREVFGVILNYLRQHYSKGYHVDANPQTIEGIKDIMVLVGEAAKKLDKYAALTQKTKARAFSVKQLAEYKELQEFYLTRIARKIDESVLSHWILALSEQLHKRTESLEAPQNLYEETAKHVVIDLDSVKKDTEYELFFIRKEDGSRFFNPRIIRNMKLVCDFGNYPGEQTESEALESIDAWRVQVFHLAAKNILNAVAPNLNAFYHHLNKTKNAKDNGQLEQCLSRALMALMLASNRHHAINEPGVKNSAGYFVDFHNFLRQATHTPEYQKLIAYPSEQKVSAAVDLVHGLCESLFTHLAGHQILKPVIANLLQEANKKQSADHHKALSASRLVSDRLASDYAAMTKLLKGNAHGPLVKVLTALEEGSCQAYDPFLLENIPNQQYTFTVKGKEILNVRLPAPIYQEYIDKPVILEEFKGYLREIVKKGKKHLLINLQDRTSWREHGRCVVLEGLQRNSEFEDQLTVVTLPKDTEFYHQLAPYDEENHAHMFIQNLKEQLADEACGFFFPEKIKEALFPDFVNDTIESIHRDFFGGKNVLLHKPRLDFIEIFYLFLEMRLIELSDADTVSFTCKDGVDVGVAASVPLFIVLRWMEEENLLKTDFEELNLMLYGPAMMCRERTMLADRFNRMQKAIRAIEHARRESGWQAFARALNLSGVSGGSGRS